MYTPLLCLFSSDVIVFFVFKNFWSFFTKVRGVDWWWFSVIKVSGDRTSLWTFEGPERKNWSEKPRSIDSVSVTIILFRCHWKEGWRMRTMFPSRVMGLCVYADWVGVFQQVVRTDTKVPKSVPRFRRTLPKRFLKSSPRFWRKISKIYQIQF